MVPKIRLAISSQWRVRETEAVLRLLDSVRVLCPPEIYGSVLSQLIVPRLKHEIGQWNPRADPVAVHTWILPWHGVIPGNLAPSVTCDSLCVVCAQTTCFSLC